MEIPPNETQPEKNWIEYIMDGYRKARPFVAILLAVALMTVSAIDNVKWKVGVLISLGVALIYLSIDLYKLVTAHVAEIKKSLTALDKHVKELEDPLYKAAYGEKLGKPEVQVAIKMFKASKRAARQLQHPKHEFFNHQDYTNELIYRIERMIVARKGSIYAACGEKDWEHPGTKRWFARNFDALKFNVSINRVFIEEVGWNARAAEREMQEQANKGINVRFAESKTLKEHAMLNYVPKGFGFVIFDYGNNKFEVIVHNDPLTEKTVIFDDSMIVGQFLSTFHELSSDAYSRKVIGNQTAPGIVLEQEIIKRTDELTMHVKHLLDYRFSNLQLSFINWRLGTELNKVRSVLNGELPIYAFDKIHYLSDIFGHLQRQLKAGDIYQTISTVDIWSGKNIGSKKFLQSTLMALRSGAAIQRMIYVDARKLENPAEHQYHEGILFAIELFNGFAEKDNPNNAIGFFIDEFEGDFHEILQHAPVALITENGNHNRLGIFMHNASNESMNTIPFLNLKFYFDDDYDKPCQDFIENFEEIKRQSIGLDQMRNELFGRYPELVKKSL